MEQLQSFRGYDLRGYVGHGDFDGIEYTVGVVDKQVNDYLFTETLRMTGTAIVIMFKKHSDDKAILYLKNLAIRRAKARIDSQMFTISETYVMVVTSDLLKDSRKEMDEGKIVYNLLTSLYYIRRTIPTNYKNELIEIEGFCSLFNINRNDLLYVITILEEKELIVCVDINIGSLIYITNKGIDYLQRLKQKESERPIPNNEAADIPKIWDVFISHASEDKQDIVELLALELKKFGVKVWYDKWTLTVGDSLRKKIDEGLGLSRYGVVVLSPAFFKKQWTNLELGGLLNREVSGEGDKVILPVWHNISPREVSDFSPILSDKLGLSTNQGILNIAKQIAEVVLGENIQLPQDFTDTTYLSLDITYKYLSSSSSGDIHKYFLVIHANVKTPPVLNKFRLCIMWPNDIKILSIKGLSKGREIKKEDQYYTEYWLEMNNPIYPGEERILLNNKSLNIIQYQIDNEVWNWLNSKNIKLFYKIYFEQAMPEEGSISFKKLNFF